VSVKLLKSEKWLSIEERRSWKVPLIICLLNFIFEF